jgi:hypothetical protein
MRAYAVGSAIDREGWQRHNRWSRKSILSRFAMKSSDNLSKKRISTMNALKSQLLAAIVVLIFPACSSMSTPAQDRPVERSPLFKIDLWTKSLAFAPNGRLLACDLSLRDLAGKEVAQGQFDKDLPGCLHVAFSPNGKQLASVHFDDGTIQARHAICLWNITADNKLLLNATLQLKKDQHPRYRSSLYYLTFSPDGKMLASREPDESTVIWDTTSGKELVRLDTHGLALAFAPDGLTLTAITRDGLVQHWDLATKKCVDPPDSAKREDFLFVENAIASADGKTLALADDYSVLLKDAHSGKTLRRFDNLCARRLALSPDGKTFAVSCRDGVVLFDRETGKALAQLTTAAKTWVQALAFSPDAKCLAVAIEGPFPDSSVMAWEIAKLSPVRKDAVGQEPASMPLEAKLTSEKDSYPLNLDGKTPEEFAKYFRGDKLPPSPKVDLVLTLRNAGTKPLAINPDFLVGLYLIGDGAVNHPWEPYQTVFQLGDEPKKVTLEPGKTYQIPIRSLARDHSRQSYWLLPGEYTLHAGVFVHVSSAPDGTEKASDGSGFASIKAPPLKVKVVLEKK